MKSRTYKDIEPEVLAIQRLRARANRHKLVAYVALMIIIIYFVFK